MHKTNGSSGRPHAFLRLLSPYFSKESLSSAFPVEAAVKSSVLSSACPGGAIGTIMKPWLPLSLGKELEQQMGACSSDHSGEKSTDLPGGRKRSAVFCFQQRKPTF